MCANKWVKIVTKKLLIYKSNIFNIFIEDLVLDNSQGLKYCKTQSTNHLFIWLKTMKINLI